MKGPLRGLRHGFVKPHPDTRCGLLFERIGLAFLPDQRLDPLRGIQKKPCRTGPGLHVADLRHGVGYGSITGRSVSKKTCPS